MPSCCVSVDLDEIHQYLAIHGLTDTNVHPHLVFDVAVPRLLDWADRRGFKLTLFAVGADLERPANRAVLARAAERGHEIGNHSHSHAYDLSRKDSETISADIAMANRVIEAATGFTPRGFRAPGYTITDPMYEILDRQGFAYSSSVFPCFTYYAAKVSAIGLKRLFGRKSSSVVDDPHVLLAPTAPYRVGRPYWNSGIGLLEMPIQTTPWLRLPFIGTTLTMLGPAASRWLSRQVASSAVINLELHGIDVLGSEDGLAPLAAHQYDVRIPARQKVEALDAALDQLQSAGVLFETLQEVAFRFDLEAHHGQKPAS